MRIYIGMDDTDSRGSEYGTGRWPAGSRRLCPGGCRVWAWFGSSAGDERIPYSSHNSSACVVGWTHPTTRSSCGSSAAAALHVGSTRYQGATRACACADRTTATSRHLMSCSRRCTREVVNQDPCHAGIPWLPPIGPRRQGDGIIGAAAAVGLTASGQCGRFIEFGRSGPGRSGAGLRARGTGHHGVFH
jgi:hypothetical protein